MTLRRLITSGCAFALLMMGMLMMAAAPARADLGTLTFSSAVITAHAGDTVTFNGFVTNLQTFPVVLGGDNLPVIDPHLINFDDTGYFTDMSGLTVAAGGSTEPTDLFTVQVDPSTPIGVYSGTFEVLQDTTNAVVGSANFSVNVVGISSVSPEPSSLLLGLVGFAVPVALLRKRKA